jgi:hypothetical protein
MKRVMRVPAVLSIASILTACATQSTTTAPDTDRQRKVRGDLEQCNSSTGNRAETMTVNPEGKYSFQVTGVNQANTILQCMTGKGYAGRRLDNPLDHGAADMRRSGGEGEPPR